MNVRASWALPAILVVAAAARCAGLNWGLPDLYEEATPLTVAWRMGGWGSEKGFDPNPRFFNYPTLVIHVHLLALAAMYAVMKVIGSIRDGVDFAALFLTEPGPFILTARAITVGFAVATVAVTARVATRLGARDRGFVAAALLALHPFHMAHSRRVEVDIPLTLLATSAIAAALGVLARPDTRRYVLAGLALGLATSAKYTGALTALPLLAAHLLARRSADADRPPWTRLVVAASVAAAAFAGTSPFVLLDFESFRSHWQLESGHMAAGHFGRGEDATLLLYLRSLAGGALGAPLLVLAAAGLVLRRRGGATAVVAAFVIPYLAVVCSWEMHADRYLLPVMPPLIALASVGLGSLMGGVWSRARVPGRAALAVAAPLVLLVVPQRELAAHPDGQDWRPLAGAKSWLQENAEPGAFVVSELGLRLLGATELAAQPPELRARYLERSRAAVYAVQWIPMFQVEPERSAAYYEPRLHEMADFLVTTPDVRSRYEKNPAQFAAQVALYERLDREWERVATFPGREGAAAVYRNPNQVAPFGRRGAVAPPFAIAASAREAAAADAYYYQLGLNYQTFGYLDAALQSYRLALESPVASEERFLKICAGIAGTLAVRDRAAAASFLSTMASGSTAPHLRARLLQWRDSLPSASAPAPLAPSR